MSDNLAFMQGSGALIASDDIDGVQLLRVKVQTGVDGAAADVSADNPMPVSLVTAVSGVDLGAVNLKPTTAGGLSVTRVLGLSTTAVSVKSSAGQVFGWHISNTGTAGDAFVKLYNVSAAQVGTDPAFLTLFVASGHSIAVEFANGIAFDTAISVAATANYQDTDTTAPAGVVIANVFYA